MDTVLITSGEYSGQTGTLIREYDGTLYIELSMRLHPSIGNGDNRYIIVDTQESHGGTFHQIECVWFCGRENLGDQIFCDAEGQRIWMCEYHTKHMYKEVVEIIVD